MKKYRPIYYDTETTGVKSGSDRIIELAAYDAEKDATFCSFINPGIPIPPESTAISNITDAMVKDAPSFQEIAPRFVEFCAGNSILIAHNNDAFDQLFLEAEFSRASHPFPSWKFLDSLKWSRKYRNDLPRHSLQFLREVYGIQSNQAHRALDDVLVLHQVFSRMIDDLPLEKVAQLLQAKPATVRMPFGKHAGKPLADVPKDYVRWLVEKGAFDGQENAPLKAEFVKLGLISQ
jgi:DNA polymerase III subunit epsilon